MRGIFNSVYISDLATNISTDKPQAVNLLVQLPRLLPGFTTVWRFLNKERIISVH